MKYLAIVMLIASFNQSFAKEEKKVKLKTKEVAKILNQKDGDSLKNLYVYLSRDFVAKYSQSNEDKYEVGKDNVSLGTSEDINDVVYTNEIRGNIIDWSSSPNPSYIYVSFTKECEVQECALKFVARNGKFFLAGVPAREGYSGVKVKIPSYDLDVKKKDLSVKLNSKVDRGVVAGFLTPASEGVYMNPLFGKITLKIKKSDFHRINKMTEIVEGR